MVPVDADHPSADRLAFVGGLANTFGARVIGVTACDHSPSAYFEAGLVPQDPIEEDRGRLRKRMAIDGERFRKILSAQNVKSEWRSAIGWPVDFVAREARAADLIVSFGRDSSEPVGWAGTGELVLKGGRPVLMVPDTLPSQFPGKVLVAWKDTREARRALHDALPILARSEAVKVVEVFEWKGERSDTEARLADVVSWLALHGVKGSGSAVEMKGDAESDIETIAGDFSADLVVAGGYGHTRLGEWIFGGMTRSLLDQKQRLVLFSH